MVRALLVDDDHVFLSHLSLFLLIIGVFLVRHFVPGKYLQAVLPIIYLGLVFLLFIVMREFILVEGLEICEPSEQVIVVAALVEVEAVGLLDFHYLIYQVCVEFLFIVEHPLWFFILRHRLD